MVGRVQVSIYTVSVLFWSFFSLKGHPDSTAMFGMWEIGAQTWDQELTGLHSLRISS